MTGPLVSRVAEFINLRFALREVCTGGVWTTSNISGDNSIEILYLNCFEGDVVIGEGGVDIITQAFIFSKHALSDFRGRSAY